MGVQDGWGALLGRPKVRSRAAFLLWLLAAVVATVRIGIMVTDPSLPGEPWQTSDGHLEDFRDIVWAPGRFLLDGGNPYDPATYLLANPWAQQFSPYPPAWLLLGVVLAPLPFLVAAVLFQVLSLAVAVVMLRLVGSWALPRFADLAVPAALVWINVWYPGRGSLASMGTVLVVLGIVLVLRSLTGTRTGSEPGTRSGRTVDVGCAVGIGLVAIKPHFGVLVIAVAIAGGRWREVWRGLLGIVVASVPVFVACSFAAGGAVEFVRSVLRNVVYVNGPDTPAGLGSAFQRRLDLLGILAHYGPAQPPWMSLVTPLAAVAVAVVVVRLTRNPFLVSTVVCAAVLIGFFHPWYDVLLMIVPVALGIGMVLRDELPGTVERLALVPAVLVVVHLHTVTNTLFPGLSADVVDTVDLVLLATALLLATAGAVAAATRRRQPATTP